jgi:uncharacterized membrane protein YgdD (TMEM256/DUF423 family)
MHKKYLATAAILGALGVALGAFGAHGLQRITQDEKILHSYQTGVQYQLYHALAILALSALAVSAPGKWIRWAFNSFCAGILLFSGSLYTITYIKVHGNGNTSWIGPVTPLGGLLLILGWVFLLVAALSHERSKD